MSTSHQSPPSGTCHTEFLVENKDTYLDTRAHHETRDRWEGANQFKQSDKARQSKTIGAKLHSNGTTMNALSEIFKAVNNQRINQSAVNTWFWYDGTSDSIKRMSHRLPLPRSARFIHWIIIFMLVGSLYCWISSTLFVRYWGHKNKSQAPGCWTTILYNILINFTWCTITTTRIGAIYAKGLWEDKLKYKLPGKIHIKSTWKFWMGN